MASCKCNADDEWRVVHQIVIPKVINSNSFMLDCRSSCSMNIALLMRLNFQNSTVQQLLKLLFKNTSGGDDEPLSPWLLRTSITSLSHDKVTPTGRLCLYYGLLALLELSDLALEYDSGKCLLTDAFLEEFLLLGNRCQDTSTKLLAAKSVTLWTNRARKCLSNKPAFHNSACLKADVLSPVLKHKFEGSRPLLQRVLQYVWNTWEDPVDHIRLNAIEVFQMLLKVHSLAVMSDIKTDKFMLELCNTLLFEINWSCKGKYGTLSALVNYTGATYFLHLNPDLPSDILSQMKEQTLACYACELYEKMSAEHYSELCCDHSNQQLSDVESIPTENWFTYWVDPILKVLAGTDKTHKTHVIEYNLPKMLKSGRGTLEYMISKLTSSSWTQKYHDADDISGRVGALVMCLRRARVMGLLKQSKSNSASDELLYGVVSIQVVRQALNSCDEQIRLDALALLCENHKTSELIVRLEFDLVKYFLPWNLNNQSPSFRQHLVSHLKKFFSRYKESEGALIRQLKKYKVDSTDHIDISESLSYYQDFLSWITGHLFHCLYPGSAFARRTTCLSVISLMVDMFGVEGTKNEKYRPFCIADYLCQSHVQTLLECLTDTFEENKMEAFKILQYCSKYGLTVEDPLELTSLLQTALELAGSTKPQDSTTGAYLFKVILLQENAFDVLVNCKNIIKPYIVNENWESIDLPAVENNQSGRSLLLLWILLSCLQDQVEVAKNSLIMAAANRPLYPSLHCIRYLLFDVNLKNIHENQVIYWQSYVLNLLSCTLEISDVVSPVVHNSSPEGNVPLEAIRGSNLKFESLLQSSDDKSLMLEAEKSKETVMLMPEYLVVCCWRSIKEVSLLLGQLTVASPISDPTKSITGLLSFQQLSVIGEYFTKQLLESYHRGAFELAYAGFVKMCDMLWKSNIPDLHQLPSSWMATIMEDIKSDEGNSKLCATRRSAGVPFYVQAIVTTEPVSTGRSCFKHAMVQLLELAISGNKETSKMSDSQVHALNILRSLFRDTRLGDDVSPFIADGVKASILGFQSPFWAVRNSATLLLSAMMTRIFGVKRSKDETNISKKNCQTGRAFFHRYPTLYKFLLDQLEEATANISGEDGILHLHPALYPLLMILGRLFPSPMEGADTSLNLAPFIPHVIRCASSPVLKTRIMAAKALQPLVHKDQLTSVFDTVLDLLPNKGDKSCTQSHIHGLLLQVQQLMSIIPTIGDSLKENIWMKIITLWSQKLWLIGRENSCYVTRREAMKITSDIIWDADFQSDPISTLIVRIQDHLLSVLNLEAEMFTCQSHVHLPGFTDFLLTLASLQIMFWLKGDYSQLKDGVQPHFGIENVILMLLNCASYEVRIMVLKLLKKFFSKNDEDDDEQDIVEIYKVVSKNDKMKGFVANSVQLLEKLLQMALYTEWHHECHIEVFEVLKDHPLLQQTAWPIQDAANSPHMVLTKCIEIIQTNSRDEVKSAVIEFSGCVITHLMYCCKQAKTDPQGEGQHVEMLCHKASSQKSTIVTTFVKFQSIIDCDNFCDTSILVFHTSLSNWSDILHRYSRTEQSPELQISCIKVISRNSIMLLEDKDNIIGDQTFSFWSILMDLLQEDDLEVKEIAASIMTRFNVENRAPFHPLLALDKLIAVMVELHGVTKLKSCIDTMVSWLRGQDSDLPVQEERLFDRGEMNTYREDVIMIQLVSRHLINLVFKVLQHQQQQQQHPSNELSTNKTCVKGAVTKQQQKNSDVVLSKNQAEGKNRDLCQQEQKEICIDVLSTNKSQNATACKICSQEKCNLIDCVTCSCQYDIDMDVLRQLSNIFTNHYPNDISTDSLENQITLMTDSSEAILLKDDSNTISNIFCDFLLSQQKKLFFDKDLGHMSPLKDSGSHQCLVIDVYRILLAIHLCTSIKCKTVYTLCGDVFSKLEQMLCKTNIWTNNFIAPLVNLRHPKLMCRS